MPKAYDIGLTVTLPADNPYGGKYTLRLGECTGIDELDVRRETGQTLMALMSELSTDPGSHIVAAGVVVWLTRRKQFAHLTFQDVARSITWGSDFDLSDADEDDEGKASGSEDSPKNSESRPSSRRGTGSGRSNSTS